MRHLLVALLATFAIGVSSVQAQEKAFLGKTASQWGTLLKSPDAKQRRSAAFALGKLGKYAVPSLPTMKSASRAENDPKVKDALIFALGEICRDSKDAQADPALEAIFLDAARGGDIYVRRSGVYGLGCLGRKSNETLRGLDVALGDPEPIVRQNAAWALGQNGLEALPFLPKALRDTDSLVKRDAVSAFSFMNDAAQVHAYLKDLLPLCRDNNSEVRRATVNVLASIVEPKDMEAIPALVATLDDPDVEIRRNAALALSNIGGLETARALPILLEAIKNGDQDLRRQSVLAIRTIGPSAAAAVPELVALLRDDADAKVREHAALALGGIGANAAPAIPHLVKKIQSRAETREIRIECAMALARIGETKEAATAVPELLAVMGDTTHDPKVRERIMWAIRVHNQNLGSMTGTRDTFARIVQEPRSADNRMLRYDCAYMLGMIWKAQAPDSALNVLSEYLDDKTIQIFVGVDTSVGSSGEEVKGGPASVKVRTKGDGRTLACDALQSMGAGKYGARGDIVAKLSTLANDATIYEPLRKKAAALVQAAK